jgi:carboxymethylenebutenolidase
MTTSGKWEAVTTTDGTGLEAYVVRPVNSNGQGIVLLQEVFGINASIRDVAHWMADQGYLVAAPDIFWRIEPHVELGPAKAPYFYDKEDTKAAFSYLERLDERYAVDDIAATVRHIKMTSPETRAVHLVGFCLGGKLAILGARDKNVASAISFYGVGIETELGALANARCPMQLHFGGRDRFIPASAVATIEVESRGRDIEIYIYPDANHGFFSNGRKAYDPQTADLAWTRVRSLMQRTLPDVMGELRG